MIAQPEMVENDVDPLEQDPARFQQPAMALAGGIAAALVIATLPHVYLENIIGATGLSEIIPAAAPPLGNTARGLIAAMAGLVSTSALYLFLNHKTNSLEGGSDMSLAIRRNLTPDPIEEGREVKTRFSLPKLKFSAKSLTKFLKKPKKSPGQVTELKDLPNVRSADRHPDAPARQPIFASTDLGAPLAEKIKRFEQPEAEENQVVVPEPPAQESEAATSLVADEAPHSSPEQVPSAAQPDNIVPQAAATAPHDNLDELSLAQLADRLEAGLRRLEALDGLRQSVPAASAPAIPSEETVSTERASEPPAPVSAPPLRSVDTAVTDMHEARQADMDAALKAALGTLERMTAQR